MNKSAETNILTNWKLKLGILFAVISPTVTGTAAYYNLQIKLDEKNQITQEKINQLELRTEKNFASKETMEKIRDDMNRVKEDIVEIKVLLKRKLK